MPNTISRGLNGYLLVDWLFEPTFVVTVTDDLAGTVSANFKFPV